MEGGCTQRGTLGHDPSAASASTTILSTAASHNCGHKARGKLRVGMWEGGLTSPDPLAQASPGPPGGPQTQERQ